MTMPTPQERRENLWLRALRNYWSDPANVIGPPGALVRRMMKALWLVLSFYVLFWIAGPSQVASWQLWMEDDQLAEHIAWGFTFAAALCFAIVGYVAMETEPVRVPVPFPVRLWPPDKWRWAQLHMPNIRVTLGSILAAALFLIALLGQWNYYLHDNLSTGGASVAALEGSDNRVAEAEAALAAGIAAYAAADQQYGDEIARTPANYATARSRLMNERRQAANDWRSERARLENELREARAQTVTVRQVSTDPRPVDGQVAGATGLERGLVSSLLDLLRSGVVEALLVMGAGLGLAGATSRIGVPSGETVSREKNVNAEEIVAETAPAEPEPDAPPPRRRFTLPLALPPDYAAAAVVGPAAWTQAEEPVAEDAPAEAPEAADAPAEPAPEAEVDPLVAEHLNEMEPEHV